MKIDTRNNWMTFQFVTKCRFKCFRRQSVIDSCVAGIKEVERFGFEFGEMNFPLNHVHLSVNVPKKYSVGVVITMLKSRSAKRIFAEHPGFRKRYPRGSFWSQYEHHQSTGHKDKEAADAYIRGQLRHHDVEIIDDTQQRLTAFTAERGYGNFRRS
ncbi:MAG: IS200/IS605 family transposase [Nanoarchaeota archaeon]|nr:IS200/IS605 family transposase [Nanoarchaeota archaeon]